MVGIVSFDTVISKYIRSWPPWLQPFMRLASFIGEPAIVVSAAVLALALAHSRHHPQIVWGMTAAMIAFGLSTTLKLFLHRTRPDTLYVTTMRFKSYSFPSGHTFGSSLIYGLLIDLAHRYLVFSWAYIVASLGTVLIVLIGLSRIYLGAHFPTDVLGAWLFSLLALFLIVKFF